MKTTKQISHRLYALALAVLLMLTAVASTVMAAEAEPSAEPDPNQGPFTITINNASGLPAMVDGQFAAYQIFTGTVYHGENDGTVENDDDAFDNTWLNYSLADIEWGASMDKVTPGEDGDIPFIKALKESTAPEFNGAFNSLDPKTATAAQVAEILVGKNNAFLQAFCSLIVGDGAGEENSFLKAPDNSDAENPSEYPIMSTANNDETDPAKDTSTITVDQGGYYLIVEEIIPHGGEEDHPTDEVISEYMLAVVGNQTINIKSDVPQVDKSIIDGTEGGANGEAAGIGDTVSFRLSGTLPRNFDDYDWYYYSFVDTLSKGLTYVADSVNIYVDNGTGLEEIQIGSVNSEKWVPGTDGSEGTTQSGMFPTVTPTTNADGTTTLVIDFGDLQKGYEQYSITANTKIIVEYDATLNSDAVIGVEGNPNTVHLVYSNDPNDQSSQGNTPDDTVWVYTLGLDIYKIDLTDDVETPLSGATFYLTKTVTQTNEETGESADVVYYYHYDKTTDENGQETINVSWIKQNDDGSAPDGATQLVTDEDGKFITPVIGLDADVEYTLTEIKAPNGYNTIDPFSFTFTVEIDENGQLTNITVHGDGADDEDDSINWTIEHDQNDDGTDGQINGHITVTVIDPKAPYLPFTGGIGTAVFYIGGCVLFLGAIAFLVFSGKKSKKNV